MFRYLVLVGAGVAYQTDNIRAAHREARARSRQSPGDLVRVVSVICKWDLRSSRSNMTARGRWGRRS